MQSGECSSRNTTSIDDSAPDCNNTSGRVDTCDTFDDTSSDTISKEKLRHELRVVNTRLLKKSLILETDHVLHETRENELRDQIQTLTRRLTITTSRCAAAMQAAEQASGLQAEFEQALVHQRQLTKEYSTVAAQLTALTDYLSSIITDRLIYTTSEPGSNFHIDVEAYSQLVGSERQLLIEGIPGELTAVQHCKVKLHRLVSLFSKELSRLRNASNQGSVALSNESQGTHRPRMECIPSNDAQGHQLKPAVLSKDQFRLEISDNHQKIEPQRHVHFDETNAAHVTHPDRIPDSGDAFHEFNSKELSSSDDPDFELEILRQKIDLTQQDKEYLTNQVSLLTQRLSEAGERINTEKQNAASLTAEVNDLREKQSMGIGRLSMTDRESVPDRLRSRGMANLELKQLRDQYEQDMSLIREQRDRALNESAHLRRRLEQLEVHQIQARHQFRPLGCTESDITGFMNGKPSDPAIHDRVTRATLEVDSLQAARKDALLQVEKVSRQLEASKKAYYELEAKCNREQALRDSHLHGVEAKLHSYEQLERQLNEAIEQTTYEVGTSPRMDGSQWLEQIIPLCFTTSTRNDESGETVILPTLAARRLEHALRLSQQVGELRRREKDLCNQLVIKNGEVEAARKEADRLASIISFTGEPADSLITKLTKRERDIRCLQEKMTRMETHLQEQRSSHAHLTEERNLMAKDLDRLLNRRQDLSKLRKQLQMFVTEAAEKFRIPNNSSCSCRPQSTMTPPLPYTRVMKRIVRTMMTPPYDVDRS